MLSVLPPKNVGLCNYQLVQTKAKDVPRPAIYDLFDGPWSPDVHPHKKLLTKLLRPAGDTLISKAILDDLLCFMYTFKSLSWVSLAREFLRAATSIYAGEVYRIGLRQIPRDIRLHVDLAVQDVCMIIDTMTQLAYRYTTPYSSEFMNLYIERLWKDICSQLENHENLMADAKGHVFSYNVFGSIYFVEFFLKAGEKSRFIGIFDTGLGYLLLYDGLTEIYGWIHVSKPTDWSRVNRYVPWPPVPKPNPVPPKHFLSPSTYIHEYGIGSSKVSVEAYPDTNRVKEPKNIKFAEFQDGKLYIEGEHDTEGKTRPSLKLTNSRYANHTAVGYKQALSAGGDKVVVKLGFLSDTKLSTESEEMVKHRCDIAEVIAMARIDVRPEGIMYAFDVDEACSIYDPNFKYPLGGIVKVEGFDPKVRGCSTGIHFFFNQIGALTYRSEKGLVFRDSYDMMSNAVYHKESLGYVYAPVTEAATKIQQEWRYWKNLRKDKKQFIQDSTGIKRTRIADMDEISPERDDSALTCPNSSNNILNPDDDTVPLLSLGVNFGS